ncbi:MAG TPA: Imm74 family immunity protein [Candidatus Paceibacterota bacterium]|nr:Imm74 family immunity protein [Candidatus Paceibacterota bacterium]
MRIGKTTSSSIEIQDGERVLKIEGEAFERGSGSPDFIIYANSIREWQTPTGSVPISDEERKKIISFVIEELSKRGWKITSE